MRFAQVNTCGLTPQSYRVRRIVMLPRYSSRMSYNLTAQCGCLVYVSCHPKTGIAHARVIERKGDRCRVRTHEIGVRVYLQELLPESSTPPMSRFDTA